jgi:hypothetical protein
MSLEDSVIFLTQREVLMTHVYEVNFLISSITMYNIWCLCGTYTLLKLLFNIKL